MEVVKQSLISVLQVVAGIMVIIGASVIWNNGPDVVMSMLKAANYQVKDGVRAPFNTRDIQSNNPSKSNPIVRLHTTDGRFFCSGTVISDRYVVGATHCVVNVLGKMRDEKLLVISEDRRNTQEAYPVAVESMTDLALIEGDFRSFNKMRILVNPNDLNLKDHFKVCGFPLGVPNLTCYPTNIKGNQYFSILGDGVIQKGMSGGPGIDIDKNLIITVSTAVAESGIILSPVIGIFSLFGIVVQ